MTYCVGIKLNAGLVFLSDSRTNAGVDNISTFRKMIVYEKPGDRFMVLLSAGNLSISQSVREILQVEQLKETRGRTHHDLERHQHVRRRRVLGQAVRHVYDRDAESLQARRRRVQRLLIFGGQIKGEGMRLFQVYSAGNFIEATPETPYFQIGEYKYGKPVLDRVLTPDTPLDEAAKCALVSMDSTMKSNLSVGPPLDLVVYEANRSRPTSWSASTCRTRTTACCTTAGARSCARCSTAWTTRSGTTPHRDAAEGAPRHGRTSRCARSRGRKKS
jgi:putative proteasome-type protease